MSWRNTLLTGIPRYLWWIRRWRTRVRAWLIWPLVASHSSTLEPARGILERGIRRAIQSQYLDHYLFHQKLGFNSRWGIHFMSFQLIKLCIVLYFAAVKYKRKWGYGVCSFPPVWNTTLGIITWLLDTAVKCCSKSCWNLFPDPVLLLLYHTGTWLLK